MNKEQVIIQLVRLYENGIIFDTKIRVALNLAILELSGGGDAETPPKVKKVFDKIKLDTDDLMKGMSETRAKRKNP